MHPLANKLPTELQKHCLSFLPSEDLLKNVRLVDKYWQDFTEQTINEQKRRLTISPKNRPDVIPPPINLFNTFSYLKILFCIEDIQEEVSSHWDLILNLLNKPNKDITLEMHKGFAGTLAQEEVMAKFSNYFKQLNKRPSLRELSIFYPLKAPLELPDLESLTLTITDYDGLKAAFNPLPELKDLKLYLKNTVYLDLSTLPALVPNLQTLYLQFEHGTQPLLNNLPALNNITQLSTLILCRAKSPEVNLSFNNLPLTKLHLGIYTPNLQTLNLPTTLTELKLPILEPSQRERHIHHLFEDLSTMCPKITTLFLNDLPNLCSLTPKKLATLPYLSSIQPNFVLTMPEMEELILNLQKHWPDLEIHKSASLYYQHIHLQMKTSTLLNIIFRVEIP